MKFRHQKPGIMEQNEDQAVRELRSLTQAHEQRTDRPSSTYWANLLVRTNRRIDEKTSGKAISLSWAARVAIPGVVAIISFFVAMHYYTPDIPRPSMVVGPILTSFSDNELDSLLTAGEFYGTVANDPVVGSRLFAVAADQAADYLLSQGRASAVLEVLSDNQVDELLAVLNAPRD